MGVDPRSRSERLAVDDLVRLQDAARRAVYVDPGVLQYAVDLVTATRDPARHGLADLAPYLDGGVSSRATLGLVAAARALALLRRRSFALPQDVYDVAPEVLTHRLGVPYDALAQGVEPGHLLARILATVPAPRLTPTQDPRPGRCPLRPAPATEATAGPAGPRPPPGVVGMSAPPDPRRPRPPRPSAASSSRSPGASTACCTATTPGGSPGSAPRPARAAATPPGTTPGASTGT